MFYESDIEKAIIELLIDKGYSYIDDTNNWVVERQLSDFINEEGNGVTQKLIDYVLPFIDEEEIGIKSANIFLKKEK